MAIRKRFDERIDRQTTYTPYDITRETFDVYVPEGYDGREDFGVMVWMSGGEPPEEWRAVLDQLKVMWVAPNGVTSGRDDYENYGLAIDALANLVRQYDEVDKKRLMIGGEGYGGQIAMRMGIAYSDTFNGSMTVGAVDFFRRVQVPDDNRYRWVAAYPQPAGGHVGRARQNGNYVFYVPSDADPQGSLISTISNGYGEMKFRNLLSIQTEGSGTPTAEQFGQGVAYLAR